MGKKPGKSYQKRVSDINRIYDQYAKKESQTGKYGAGTYILCMVSVNVPLQPFEGSDKAGFHRNFTRFS